VSREVSPSFSCPVPALLRRTRPRPGKVCWSGRRSPSRFILTEAK
jgi:hypothetical protein